MSPLVTRIPKVIAHRGNAAEFPENTLPGLRSALELGTLYVEFDVHLTADHMPVVLHDTNLMRTAGLDRDALEMTWAELSQTMVNEPSRFATRYSDVGVPSLARVVDLLSGFPNATAFVEIKRASLRTFGLDTVVRRICDVLKPVASRAVVISFDLPAVDFARRYAGSRIGWVVTDYNSLSALKAEALTPDFLFADHQALPPDTSRLWRGPWQWAIYEVTRSEQAMALAARGAHFIETMEVRSMLRQFRYLQTQRGQ
jgi:glycerophosphoryl diester phosphodiesterase